MIIGATKYFQVAVEASEDSVDAADLRVGHLANLALSRLAYSVALYETSQTGGRSGLFDVALYYYRKVPVDSTNYVNALYESGWSYFLKGDTKRGMGIFHTMDGPDWDEEFLPDMYLLEATVFMNLCRFDNARQALRRFEKRYMALQSPIQRYLEAYPSPEEMYDAFVLQKTKAGATLPRMVRLAVLSDNEFYDQYTTVTQYRREVAAIKNRSTPLGSDLSGRLLDVVENRKREDTVGLGLKITEILENLNNELEGLSANMDEIEADILSSDIERIEEEIQAAYKNNLDVVAQASAEQRASAIIGSTYMTWPFEGEYWSDEVNSYRSELKEQCGR